MTGRFSLYEDVLTAQDAQAAAQAFGAAARRGGASFVQVRYYRRPTERLTSERHWAAGGVLLRDAARGWVGSTGFDYICFEQNPLLEPIRRGMTRYRFSDFAPHRARHFGRYWDALSSAGIRDAICATAYGSDRRIASVHVGIPDPDVGPDVERTVAANASVLVERIMEFAMTDDAPSAPALSEREADAIRFVAEGKTDWEIGQIVGISEATARFHVDNARRKLSAVNRAHAAARFVALHGL